MRPLAGQDPALGSGTSLNLANSTKSGPSVLLRNFALLPEGLPSGGHIWDEFSLPTDNMRRFRGVLASFLRYSFLQIGCEPVISPPPRYSGVRFANFGVSRRR